MAAEQAIFGKRTPLPPLSDGECSLIVAKEREDTIPSKFTIAIPTFRRIKLLQESLESACTQNTTRFYDVIIVDNDSENDCSVEITQLILGLSTRSTAQRIALYRNSKNVGMFGNWNRCFLLARAEWMTILNDDDMLSPNFVECIAQLVDRHPTAGMLQTGYHVLDRRKNNGSPAYADWRKLNDNLGSTPGTVHFLDLCLTNQRAGSLAIAYRTRTARQMGGFDPIEYPTADYCFHNRMLHEHHPAYEVKAALAAYRIQDNESLKPDVLAAFVANDFRLRMEAAETHPAGLWIRVYALATAIAQRRALEIAWDVVIPDQVMRDKLGHRAPRSKIVVFLARAFAFALRKVIRIVWRT